jgi:hypothetical protein
MNLFQIISKEKGKAGPLTDEKKDELEAYYNVKESLDVVTQTGKF